MSERTIEDMKRLADQRKDCGVDYVRQLAADVLTLTKTVKILATGKDCEFCIHGAGCSNGATLCDAGIIAFALRQAAQQKASE